ncbi:MAG: hypothetical protein GZ089_06360 [Aromatoleum sp.]|nr:hypothetical protein [Aromatoleum sp.]
MHANGKLSQAALGRELNLSRAMVTKLKQRGMPIHSVTEAIDWRKANLDPGLVKAVRRPELMPAIERDRVAAVNALGALASDDLAAKDWGPFVERVEKLRAILVVLTEDENDRVRLPLQIWDALCGFPGPWSAHTRFERAN